MAVTSIAGRERAPAAPRYEIVCRLAGGGMADLYLARATGLAGFERLVAIKRLSRQFATRSEAVQALCDEARIAATLSHPNLVQVTDVEIVDGEVSIVMELLHGHDVAQLLRRLALTDEQLPLDQAIAFGLAVCAGLHHAHERVGLDGRPLEIVHRDVSPHNVFVTYDGAVKVVDFGIARAATQRNRTEEGVIKGKPGYIAPEQLRGRGVDRRTDVWATGVLLYEMTTGARPYGQDPAALDQLLAVITRDPPPPSSRIAGYPPDLEAIVMRAMARDAAARPPTAEALRQELDAFARAHRLDLSPYRVAALMERAFEAELAAWREAQAGGLSLAEHLAALDGGSSASGPALGTGTSAPSAELAPAPITSSVLPVRRRRWATVVAGVIAAPIVALAGIAAWAALGSSPRPAGPPPGPAREALVEPPAVIEPAVIEPAVIEPAVIEPAAERPATRTAPAPPKRARPIGKRAGRAAPMREPPAPRPAEEELDAPLPR
jgi:hypothetical protein